MNNLTYFNYSYTCMYKYFMYTKYNNTYLCKSTFSNILQSSYKM